LLCGVSQIHSAALCHGDLKPENILVTSYDWLFIADIHPYKPTLIKDDDLKAYNELFGDLDNNIRCYTAPERWRSPNDSFAQGAKLEPSMDIFSAGCIIAEIMMDGLPLFDLARLQNHRRGTFDPREEL
jgi:phosphoinositide-3-kinase regulatory subunit 4